MCGALPPSSTHRSRSFGSNVRGRNEMSDIILLFIYRGYDILLSSVKCMFPMLE